MRPGIAQKLAALENLTRYNDFILAGLVVAIISLIVLPIPSPVVDTMLAVNICFSVSLLMLSLYIPSSLSLSTFPTLLLITTLFRLALNITTTRQILLNGYAGKIIYTFGNLVVGANYIVGMVVFLIITIVQFIVIAKGSERVAEVSARFTLDAMPGKQMSIDADMRAGIIDMNEALERRKLLENESKMYGAMDGAMKFVKGDAIAGLIITVINILGGIFIGSLQKGLSVAEAMEKYTILTIGDGLVSQIPALFISITSGIIVTRVDVSGASENLAGEIGQQIMGQPKAMYVAGGILGAMAMIPGFPKVQFLALSLTVVIVGSLIHFSRKQSLMADADVGISGADNTEDTDSAFTMIIPLSVELSQENKQQIVVKDIEARINAMGQDFYHEIGVPCPVIVTRFNPHLPKDSYGICIKELPLYFEKLHVGQLKVNEDPAVLKELGIAFSIDEDDPNQNIYVEEKDRQKLVDAQISYATFQDSIGQELRWVMSYHISELFGLTEVGGLLEKMEKLIPMLVKEALKNQSIQSVTELLQYLAEEQVNIRDLKLILEGIIEYESKDHQKLDLKEYVRSKMKRSLCYKYSNEEGIIKALVLDPELEEFLHGNLRKTAEGVTIAISPEMKMALCENIKAHLSNSEDSEYLILLTQAEIRRSVRMILLEGELEMPVLAYHELTATAQVEAIGRIAIDTQ